MSASTTQERILEAAIQLISEKGYASATTRAIADKAGVNEVTIFRHFGNKSEILKEIIRRFSYEPVMNRAINSDITYDLEKDLLHFLTVYFEHMVSIKDLIFIALKEMNTFPEINKEVSKVPHILKVQLKDYFIEMKKRNEILNYNEEEIALSFISMGFGHFMAYVRMDSDLSDVNMHDLLKTSVTIFSRGIAS
ncbi:TetR/AcrR family transcriptional regulator [Bacillaceae bacterium W0354]